MSNIISNPFGPLFRLKFNIPPMNQVLTLKSGNKARISRETGVHSRLCFVIQDGKTSIGGGLWVKNTGTVLHSSNLLPADIAEVKTHIETLYTK